MSIQNRHNRMDDPSKGKGPINPNWIEYANSVLGFSVERYEVVDERPDIPEVEGILSEPLDLSIENFLSPSKSFRNPRGEKVDAPEKVDQWYKEMVEDDAILHERQENGHTDYWLQRNSGQDLLLRYREKDLSDIEEAYD